VSQPLDIEGLLRRLAPRALGALMRRHRSLEACEDAMQEALLTASRRWPQTGAPEHPQAWLVTVATRRLIDDVRAERARREREERVAIGSAPSELLTVESVDPSLERDDTLTLLVMCCHESLSNLSQIALTLRAFGGLTTAQIAACFFVGEATMAQRISRAKQTIRQAGAQFEMPNEPELTVRLDAVKHVLYLICNEGYTTSSGTKVSRVELTAEAIRLTRELCRLRPDDAESAGLLALMLLTDARRAARVSTEGELIDLADQDRARWNHAEIDEGVGLITDALGRGPLGPYQLQAAIAAVHDEAPDTKSTDWAQILALYDTLNRIAPNPMANLGRTVAVAMTAGPTAALQILDGLADDPTLSDHHRYHAVRGHVLEMADDHAAARASFEQAARLTFSVPEKRYLTARANQGQGG
jgi:RNA polymerase sigma factor (sigma-70 family)